MNKHVTDQRTGRRFSCHRLSQLSMMCTLFVLSFFIAAGCAAPAPNSPRIAPAPNFPSPTPRVPLSPPTRTPIPTVKPASTVPAVFSGFARVDVGENFFDPEIITVTLGTTIQWRHVGSLAHDVLSEDSSWGVGLLPIAGYYENQFNYPGIYPYVCYIHRPGMRGWVIVVNP